MGKIYLASSWRNIEQPNVLKQLREAEHEVYDFKDSISNGFNWREIDPNWKEWSIRQYIIYLNHPIAEKAFNYDYNAMKWADVCVLLTPCGRSAHLEAGWFVGANKPLYILLSDSDPELMYKMATKLCVNIEELLDELNSVW